MKRRGFFGAVAGAVAAMLVKPKSPDFSMTIHNGITPTQYTSGTITSLPLPEVCYYDGVSVAWSEFNNERPVIGHALPASSDSSFFRPLG
jgi:hypothetical protein